MFGKSLQEIEKLLFELHKGFSMSRKDEIAILKDLIEIDTTNPPGNEMQAARYLAALLEPYGFRCEMQAVGENRANLVAEIGVGNEPELMLNGHLDVVPAVGEWKTNPFEAVCKNGKIYGRGSSDMKGGIAAMCEAAIRISIQGNIKKGKLRLVFAADEECSNIGTEYYLKHQNSGKYAIIGEPTELQIAVAHRGVSRDYIDLLGEERHAALSSDSEDAIQKAARSVLVLGEKNHQLQKISHEVLPAPSIVVTMLQGYEKDNVIPGKVRLLTDFRILPGMTHDDVEHILDEALQAEHIIGYEKSLHFYMPGGEVNPESIFVKTCLDVRKQVLGSDAGENKVCAFDASCEQCFFVEHGIETIICGPGSIKQAHTVDEYTSEDQVHLAADFYEAVIKKILC